MITRRHMDWLICALCLLALGLCVMSEEKAPAPVEIETVYSDAYGTVTQFFRTEVREDDLAMPIRRDGLLLQSGVFRLRDRKNRDLLRYAFMRFSTTKRMEEMAGFYLKALGPDARRETDKDTGEVTVFCGEKANCRVVTLTPQEGCCRLTLEHIEHFAIPPRVYTEREKQVIRVVEEISRAYQTAGHVAYTMEQRIESTPAAEQTAPVLTWQVDFHRPKELALAVSADGAVGLTIATQGDRLIITRPGQEPDQRGIGEGITSATVPELQSDPIARLALGDTLLSDEIDYLALQPIGDAPLQQQVDVVLTFPEDLAVLHLWIDRQHHVITRAETVIRQADRETHVIRTYHDTVLEPAAAPAAVSPAPPAAVMTP